jgi:hypothetical protein
MKTFFFPFVINGFRVYGFISRTQPSFFHHLLLQCLQLTNSQHAKCGFLGMIKEKFVKSSDSSYSCILYSLILFKELITYDDYYCFSFK